MEFPPSRWTIISKVEFNTSVVASQRSLKAELMLELDELQVKLSSPHIHKPIK